MGDAWTRADVEKAIMQRAMRDEAFRARLVADPKGTLAREIRELTGTEISFPDGLTVTVHEETPDSMHLVIPSGAAGRRSLSDVDLGAVVGGKGSTHPAAYCRTNPLFGEPGC